MSGLVFFSWLAGYLGAIAIGDWAFMLGPLAIFAALARSGFRVLSPEATFCVLAAVAGIFCGRGFHGSWDSPPAGPVKVIATSSSHVWRGAFLLVESSGGKKRFTVQSAKWNGIGTAVRVVSCSRGGTWLYPAVCKIEPAASDQVRGASSGRGDSDASGRYRKFFLRLRRQLLEHFDSFPTASRDWLKATALGIIPRGSGWAQNFKESGLVHFLVVSGAHVVLMHRLFRKALLLLPWLLHVFGGCAAPGFARLKLSIEFLTVFPVLVFCLVCGMDPPVQRAFSALCIGVLANLTGIALPLFVRIALVISFQASFWPVGIFSGSSGMSWVASCVVLLTASAGKLARQCLLYASMAVIFGIGTASALLANLLLLPVLELFFLFSLIIAAAGAKLAVMIRFDELVKWVWKVVAVAGWHFSGPIPVLLEHCASQPAFRLAGLAASGLLLAHVASIRVALPSIPSIVPVGRPSESASLLEP